MPDAKNNIPSIIKHIPAIQDTASALYMGYAAKIMPIIINKIPSIFL